MQPLFSKRWDFFNLSFSKQDEKKCIFILLVIINNIGDCMGVTNHITFKTPFISQHICQQELMDARRYPIYTGRHLR